jgi:surface antigen
MKYSILTCALIAAATSLGLANTASAQGLGLLLETRQDSAHHDSRDSFHRQYYQRGYDRQRFAYHPSACERRSSGIGLGIGLGGIAQIDASLGQSWTQCDRYQFSYAHEDAWSGGRVSYWQNPQTGRRGAIRPRDHYRARGRDCLSGEAETFDADGDYQRFAFESCRDGSGEWSFERRSGR